MSTDSMPMYDSLADQIKYFLLNGGDYHVAPNLGADVLDRIDTFAARFLALPNEQARHAHVLWMAHCWFMDCWQYTPRLLFISPEAGCGKTLALTVTKHLVPRPDHVADLTPAGLYHSIDEALEFKGGRPTILYDELDTVFDTAEEGRRQNEEMRRLINAGHGRDETVSRKIGKKTKRFQMYSPMALAGKMTIDDVPVTIRDRSVVIPMQRKLPEEKIERWNRYTSAAEAEELCWLLRYWAELVHPYALHYLGPDHPVLPTDIENRDADVLEALLAVGELAGGPWPERARVAAVTAVTASGVNATPSEGVRLLWEIEGIFRRLGGDLITSRQLLDGLKETGEFHWSGLSPQRAGIRMAGLLKGYGIRPTTFRDGANTFKGYNRESFADAWRRYPPQAVTAVTAAADQGDTDE